jgi:hypothetical protein
MKKAQIKIRRETLVPLQDQSTWSNAVVGATGRCISINIGCNQ